MGLWQVAMMVDVNEWRFAFKEALDKKQEWLLETGIPALKEEFSAFRTAYSTLYSMLIQNKFVSEDPYKAEDAVTSLKVPATTPLPELKKRENFSLRLAEYDNQLCYIDRSDIFSLARLKPDKINALQAIIWFISWGSLSRTSSEINTQMLAEITMKVQNNASNVFVVKNFAACFDSLYHIALDINRILEDLNNYHRESYKGDIRAYIAANMDGTITLESVKARFSTDLQGQPFLPGLIEELLAEDYSPDAQEARENVLQKLAIEDEEAQAEKEALTGQQLLLGCFYALGATSDTFAKIVGKIEYNHEIYKNKKKSLMDAVLEFLSLLFGKQQSADIYRCKAPDAADSRIEIINHTQFIEELSGKIKVLQSFAVNAANSALKAKSEPDLLEYLNNNIHDLQRYYRLLTALDEFFKTADIPNQKSIKGMKPDISTVKRALSNVAIKKECYLASLRMAEPLPAQS
jgi:hypothetical protein